MSERARSSGNLPTSFKRLLALGGMALGRHRADPLPPESAPVRRRYKPNTIMHWQQPEGGRQVDRYEAVLGFSREELRGKRVLDLGAGPEAKFARGIAAEGIGASVMSLSADYSDANYAARVRAAGGNNLAAGLANELPFADSSFDAIVALHIAEHLDRESLAKTLKEVTRVLAPGGWARIGSLAGTPEYDPYDLVIRSDTKNYMAAHQVRPSKYMIDPEVMPPARLYTSYDKFISPVYTLVLHRAPQ